MTAAPASLPLRMDPRWYLNQSVLLAAAGSVVLHLALALLLPAPPAHQAVSRDLLTVTLAEPEPAVPPPPEPTPPPPLVPPPPAAAAPPAPPRVRTPAVPTAPLAPMAVPANPVAAPPAVTVPVPPAQTPAPAPTSTADPVATHAVPGPSVQPGPGFTDADVAAYAQDFGTKLNASVTPADYPRAVRQLRIEGTVRVRVRMGAAGVPTDVVVIQPSRSPALDEKALELVNRQLRQGAGLPEVLRGHELTFVVPVRFTVRAQ